MFSKYCLVFSLLIISLVDIEAERPQRCYAPYNGNGQALGIEACTRIIAGYYYNAFTNRCDDVVMGCQEESGQRYNSEEACERDCVYYTARAWRNRRPRPPVEEEEEEFEPQFGANYEPETKA